ncbi:FAD-binding oxidoreductase [Cryobacterium sp. PH31-AA6]|uniref:FAD-binding oxidoreductase n=1 Tax=Cryobacterium sp. PH31-AA6 TaxID=3046205 RepID=UPI0024B93CAB|nr:FAD-binding oxidoreductase [Cryobacterium sp. PH31-AA6]MDJ0322354.1 FAD-binding oxidoreductase [Cryobacterium sp. PH31-AA6]
MTMLATISGGRVDLDERAVADLATHLRGELIRPRDAAYDQARRVWNGSISRFPGLIARCASRDDVSAAVRFARRHDVLVAVRGGGHSFPGHSVCDDGLVIDLSPMNGIRVDPDARTASVQAGALLGDLDRATQQHALAVPSGIVTHTGVAGLTLGGGLGWLMRKHGLSIDQLLSVGMVTADGEFVRASATENPELFWGVRGGGGNFGIVTEFEFRLNRVGPILMAGPVFWPGTESVKVLRFYREWIAEAPDDLMTMVVHRRAPDADWMPSDLRGQPVVAVVSCFAGPVDDGEEVMKPLKAFGHPVLDLCGPKPYLEHQAMFDPSYPPGRWYYMRSCDVAELTDEVIDITADHAARITSPLTAFPIWQGGGAASRVAEDDTAFHGRATGHTFNITAATEGPDGFDRERDWVRNFWSDLEPFHTSVYVNFLMDEGEERVRQAYGEAKYTRLRALKRAWDPENFFRLNQNIAPLPALG